jgi:hypothetical protein
MSDTTDAQDEGDQSGCEVRGGTGMGIYRTTLAGFGYKNVSDETHSRWCPADRDWSTSFHSCTRPADNNASPLKLHDEFNVCKLICALIN